MAQTFLRLRTAMWLVVGVAQLPGGLSALGPLTTGVIQAQVLEDPGFGDPYATGGYNDAKPNATGIMQPLVPPNFGPQGPAMPTSPSRPPSWPGGPGVQTPPPYAPLSTAGAYRVANLPMGTLAAPQPAKHNPADPPYDPAEIVAHVGSEVIQASEVLPMVNHQLETIMKQHSEELAKFPPEEREHQLNPVRKEFMKRAVDELVNVKLLLAEVREKAPPEGLAKQEKAVREWFNANELKRMMEQYKATSVIDLENKLRALGSSLDSQRNVFVERTVAGVWLEQQTKKEPQPPTHEQLLSYYSEHTEKWQSPARVRWEQLTAKFTNFNSKREAYSTLARWGNDVLRGVPFATIAKTHSQDVAAEDGGAYDWATQGSLRSTVLDAALFTLPVGTLSQIIEDEDGFHIVRVVEREEARQAPFTEVQRDIKKTLENSSKGRRQHDHLSKLRERVPVSAIFDDDFVARTSQPIAPTMR